MANSLGRSLMEDTVLDEVVMLVQPLYIKEGHRHILYEIYCTKITFRDIQYHDFMSSGLKRPTSRASCTEYEGEIYIVLRNCCNQMILHTCIHRLKWQAPPIVPISR